MVEFGQHVLVTVRRGKGLHVIDDRIVPVGRASISPFAPVTRHVSGGRERVADQNIVGAHGLFGVIAIIAICESVALVESGLLRRPGGRTDVASVAASEVDALTGESIEVGRADVGFVVGFALSLRVRADGAPAHVVDIEVEDVGPPRFSGGERCVETETSAGCKDQGEKEERVFHGDLASEGCFVARKYWGNHVVLSGTFCSGL